MTIVTHLGLLAAGMAAGAMLVISCSDDSPGSADAATCDCAPAEPPIAGRIHIVTNTQIAPPNQVGLQSNRCPDGSVLLGGGCGTEDGQPADIVLSQSRPSTSGDGWACYFQNQSATPITIKVEARCLVPAS
jgi:hypothetical protein